VAQIGVGYWGPNLLRNLMANGACQVKKVVEPSPERREFVGRLYPSVELCADTDAVLDDGAIDAVIISTPISTHFDIAMRVLESGKHILVEKPMGRSLREVEAIAKLAGEKNLVAMAGYTFLYNSAVRYIKELIANGDLGTVRYIYSQRVNLGRVRDDVDALWNLAPHDVSIIQNWLNNPEPVDVQRNGMAWVQDGIDDVVFLNIRYPAGMIANVHVSWLDPHKVRTMTVVGSEKMVVYDDIAEHKVAIYDKGIDRMAVLGQDMDFDEPLALPPISYRSGDVVLPKIGWREPLMVEIEHFFDCILNGTECISGPRTAAQVVGILEQASVARDS